MSKQPQSSNTRLTSREALAARHCPPTTGHWQPVRIPYDSPKELLPKSAFHAHFVRIPYRESKPGAANLFAIKADFCGDRGQTSTRRAPRCLLKSSLFPYRRVAKSAVRRRTSFG